MNLVEIEARTAPHSLDLEGLVERAQDLIYRYRLRPTRGFDYVNPAATRITGYSPAEHYADPDLGLKLIHPDDQPVLAALLEASPGSSTLPLRWIRKDGTVIWTEQRNVPNYDEAGELVAIEGIAREIDDPTRRPGETIRLFPGLRINLSLQRVFADGKLVHLTPSEFRLLAFLTSRPGDVVSREEIMRHLWQSDHTGTRHSCETHISTLRRKVERDPRFPERIRTVRRHGYAFAPPQADSEHLSYPRPQDGPAVRERLPRLLREAGVDAGLAVDEE
jgi:PAS domain S-box-containing protein